MAADRLEEVCLALRANGGRVTSPRRAILRALIDLSEHPNAGQLTALVQAHQPDVHESTVYRFLDELERMGVIDHVHLGHGAAVYHFADETHGHLVCELCSLVVEVPEEIFEELKRSLRDVFEFEVQSQHFALTGRCKACSQAKAAADTSIGH